MWANPILCNLVPTSDENQKVPFDCVPLPINCHHGAFGFVRKYHRHEGVDLYVPTGHPVGAVEDGVVVAIIDFTGMNVKPDPSPWWNDTKAVLVEGNTGVVLYGEIKPDSDLTIGKEVDNTTLIGTVLQVLKKDKGRPMSMLHLELHKNGTRDAYEWLDERPESLLDPTPYLLECINND